MFCSVMNSILMQMVCVCVCVCTCMHACVPVCMHVFLHVYVCTHVCVGCHGSICTHKYESMDVSINDYLKNVAKLSGWCIALSTLRKTLRFVHFSIIVDENQFNSRGTY